jgi:hypothetical protein
LASGYRSGRDYTLASFASKVFYCWEEVISTAKKGANHIHFRELPIEAHIDESSRSVELSFSSANGIKQHDFWHDEWYNEVLDHSERAVILDRLREIGVGLFNHDADKVVGRLEDVILDENAGKCRCRLVFDTDNFAETIYQKVRSGTLKRGKGGGSPPCFFYFVIFVIKVL